MRWSYRLGTWFGVAVEVHVTFLLLLAWIAWSLYRATGSIAHVTGGVLMVLALFVCVLAHEYGHALTARRFGVRTRRITLYPLGGATMLEGVARGPRAQLLIAAAGPAANFLLAGVLALLRLGLGQRPLDLELHADAGGLLDSLMAANLLLGAFNLLPAVPLDGGRVLRALLELRVGPERAIRLAGGVGQAVGVGLGVYAFMADNTILLMFAAMMWVMAGAERRRAVQIAAIQRRTQAEEHALVGDSPQGYVPRARPPSGY